MEDKLQQLYDMRDSLPPDKRRQVESAYAEVSQRGQHREMSTDRGGGQPLSATSGRHAQPFDSGIPRLTEENASATGEFLKQAAIPTALGGAAAYFGGPWAVGPAAALGETINQGLGITPPSLASVLLNAIDPALGAGGVKAVQNAPRLIPGFHAGAQAYNANRARMMHETHIPSSPQTREQIDAGYNAVGDMEAAGDNPTVRMNRVDDTLRRSRSFESDLPGKLQNPEISGVVDDTRAFIDERGIKHYPGAVNEVRPTHVPRDAEADILAQHRARQGSSGVVRTSSGEYVNVPNPVQETSIGQLAKQQQPSSPYQPEIGPPSTSSPMGLWQKDIPTQPETNSHILGNPPIPEEGQAIDLDRRGITSQIVHPEAENIRRPGFLQTGEERVKQKTPVTQSAEERAADMPGPPSTIRERVQRIQQGESLTDEGADELLDGIVAGVKKGELGTKADELLVEHGLPFSTVRKIIKRVGDRVGFTREAGGELHGFYKDFYSSLIHSVDELPQTGTVQAFKEANRAARVQMARDELQDFVEKHVIKNVQAGNEQPNWNKLLEFLRDPKQEFWRETFKDQPEVLKGMKTLAEELVKTPKVPVARGVPIGTGRRLGTAGLGAWLGEMSGVPHGNYIGGAASLGISEAIAHMVAESPATQRKLLSIVQANTGNWQHAAALIAAAGTSGSNVGAYLDNPKAKKKPKKGH